MRLVDSTALAQATMALRQAARQAVLQVCCARVGSFKVVPSPSDMWHQLAAILGVNPASFSLRHIAADREGDKLYCFQAP